LKFEPFFLALRIFDFGCGNHPPSEVDQARRRIIPAAKICEPPHEEFTAHREYSAGAGFFESELALFFPLLNSVARAPFGAALQTKMEFFAAPPSTQES
jgi:hypothetical protein